MKSLKSKELSFPGYFLQLCLLMWTLTYAQQLISFEEVDCGISHICIPKCCPSRQIIKSSGSNIECITAPKDRWHPFIYSKNGSEEESAEVTSSHLPIHVIHTPCPDFEAAIKRPYSMLDLGGVTYYGTPFRLLDTGSLALNESGEWVFENDIKIYCIDGVSTNGSYSGLETEQVVLLFGAEEEGSWNYILKLIGIFLGIIFLILTIIIYLIIWDKHNIHGWTVFSFAISMLVFLITQAISHLTHILHDRSVLETGNCVALAVIGHFTFLCILCWMSVINFDFWATFRNLSPSRGSHKSVQRYMMYFLFAVGAPSILITISMILHFTDSDVSPKYGLESCRMHSDAETYYLYIPMGVSLGFNTLMFAWTIVTLWSYKKRTPNAGSNGHKQSWILFCKLFLIMGITWIMEPISGLVLNYNEEEDHQPNSSLIVFIFTIFDIINTLCQAAAVFFIFAAKRENLLWIYRKYPQTKCVIGPILRMPLCRVNQMDLEQTEMTSVDKNNTMTTLKSIRASTASESGYN